jgi:hypothetical protein
VKPPKFYYFREKAQFNNATYCVNDQGSFESYLLEAAESPLHIDWSRGGTCRKVSNFISDIGSVITTPIKNAAISVFNWFKGVLSKIFSKSKSI